MVGLLAELRAALLEEVGPISSGGLIYGRPHESTRAYSRPRYSLSGERLPGKVTFAPDCHEPDAAGVCGHPPDGSWRPMNGVAPADLLARQLEAADGSWRSNVYDLGPDGLWRCRWPYRRAMDRLANRNVRQAVVLWRVLRGEPWIAVWLGFEVPAHPGGEVMSLARTVLRWADEEMRTEYERRPQLFGRRVGWVDKSESQRVAEGGVVL